MRRSIIIAALLAATSVHAQDAPPAAAPAPEPTAPPAAAPAPVAAPAPAAQPAPEAEPAAQPAPAAEPAAAPAPTPAAEPAPATPPAPAGSDASAAADYATDLETEAELARLLGDEDAGGGPTLRLYGFTDFTFLKLLMPDDNPYYIYFEESSTFFVGNLNLYVDGQISEDFRTLAEVRFLYLPHGSESGLVAEGEPRFESAAGDYADVNRSVAWGGIEIERVWLDWVAHQYVTVRAGQFLTPYGIWNVDHGSPVVVTARRPYIVGQELFPERQTGLQAYGSFAFGTSSTLGYHLTLSNGRGPVDQYRDLDENKAVGGRAYVRIDGGMRLTVGGSFYHGRYSDTSIETEVVSQDEIRKATDILEQYDETGLSLDAKLEYGGLLLQSEFVHNQRAYTEAGRPTMAGGLGLGDPDGFTPDSESLGAYLLIGYRIASIDLMPFAYGEYYDSPGVLVPDIATTQLGLNYQPVPGVVAKVQFTWAGSPSAEGILGDRAITALESQIAWAF